MKATAHSVRLAPKKANLIALMVRGMSVPDAVEALRLTHKKGARIVEKLLRSAMANASHNDKQNPQQMIIKSIVVNQGTAYRRGMPKARGQTRPFRKFLSHIDVVLGFAEDKIENGELRMENVQKKAGKAPQKSETPVKNSVKSSTKAKSSSGSKGDSSTKS